MIHTNPDWETVKTLTALLYQAVAFEDAICEKTAEDRLWHLTGSAFSSEMPILRTRLREDIQAALQSDPACGGQEEIVKCYPGFYAVTVYRLAHLLYDRQVALIPRMMTELAHSRTGIDIHPGAEIGGGFFIDHGTGIVIGQTAQVGKNVKLYQGVTLGALSTAGGKGLRGIKRHPTIEDDVTIYANATILGGDTVIGRGSVIGAGVFLTASVAPDTVVTQGKPALQFFSVLS